MKKFVLNTFFALSLLASNFSDGIKAYKAGNFKEARKYFELASQEEGSIQAEFMLGMMYFKGEGGEADWQKAKELLQNAEKLGNAKAKCYLAQIYLKEGASLDEIKKLLKTGYELGAPECAQIAKSNNIDLK